MAPKDIVSTGVLTENENEIIVSELPQEILKPDDTKRQWMWKLIVFTACVHFVALYGLYLLVTSAKWYTVFWVILMDQLGGYGVILGAHRLWGHKAFKAKLPLKLMLIFFETIAFQYSVITWARDHRMHHKFIETDADPHNAKRGILFSHIGWLLMRKHPEIKAKKNSVDLSDLYEDPFLRFQHKHYFPLMIVCAFIMPTAAPMYFWGETFAVAFATNVFRQVWTMHMILLLSSWAHTVGRRPYDKFIRAFDHNILSVLSYGEGLHNYHHVFPWDYRSSETTNYLINSPLLFIHAMEKIGWAYDLKTASEEMIRNRALKTGDGSHEKWGLKANRSP